VITVTVTIENQDTLHGANTIAVTNTVPFPGGTITPVAGCSATLDAKDGTPGGGPDFTSCQFQETVPITCSADDANVLDQINVSGCDAGFANCTLPVTGSTTNFVIATPLNCDDSDACTADSCTVDVGCVHTPKSCDDANACTTDSCDPATGQCSNVAKSCDDADACTADSCDPATGTCSNVPKTCNDNDTCTDDTCDPATGDCVFTDNGSCAGEGCTPGFWKNNATKKQANAWPAGTSPTQLVSSVFDIPACLQGCGIADKTLLQALSFQGGNTTCGKAEILLRAAVSAYLNSLSTCVSYPLSTGALIAEVNAALASCDSATIIAEATRLDGFNNLSCPINQQGQCTNQ
jgi:hypothetical protein